MANLTVRGLSASVHRKLKAAAKAEGRSVDSLVREILEANTDQAARRRLMLERSIELVPKLQPR
jgi:plasmid stability protein